MKKDIIDRILDEKIIAIVRGFYDETCLELAYALHRGGVNLMEVTFDQKDKDLQQQTVRTVKLLKEKLGNEMSFGAGTVTTVELVAMAKEAGAEFIVSPDTDEVVIRATVAADMVSIPGALTPSEMKQAHKFGADFVKVFPANIVGPAYFKSVHAPLSHIRMLAVGGVDEKDIKNYLAAGAVGAGVAGCLFKKDWVNNGEWDRITQAASTVTSLVKEW